MEREEQEELRLQLTALRDGNRDAFHPVFVRLWPLLSGFTARHLPAEDSEDAAQQALLNVFSRATEYDPARAALPWVLGIASYEIKTARKKRQRRREQDPGPEIFESRPAAGPSPEELLLERDLELALESALGALRPQDADTLRSYARSELPEIAAATFRKRVQRALVRLRSAWGGETCR